MKIIKIPRYRTISPVRSEQSSDHESSAIPSIRGQWFCMHQPDPMVEKQETTGWYDPEKEAEGCRWKEAVIKNMTETIR